MLEPVVQRAPSTERPTASTRATRFNSSPFRLDAQSLLAVGGDPFASYDWRRDTSGVTASSKTTYEQRFGGTGARDRTPSIEELPISSSTAPSEPSSPPAAPAAAATTLRPPGQWTARRRSRYRPRTTDQEFANFRYFRKIGNDTELTQPRRRLRPLRYASAPQANSASLNTRYAAYA